MTGDPRTRGGERGIRPSPRSSVDQPPALRRIWRLVLADEAPAPKSSREARHCALLVTARHRGFGGGLIGNALRHRSASV